MRDSTASLPYSIDIASGVQRVLVVVAHPSPQSLSHSIADRIAKEFADGGIEVEIADLQKEAFAPAMTEADVELYRGRGVYTKDILGEQARVDRADMLIIVFPVYWWSVPALLKGWFERVFAGDWAYKVDSDGRLAGIMRPIPVKLIGTAASDQSGFDRHGYIRAFHAQVVDGIFRYCGVKDPQLSLLFDADTTTPERFEEFVTSL